MIPAPREHGAWGLLLQPFVAGAILSARWTWLLVPALGLVLLGFLMREPLTVLARQAVVWRVRNPRSQAAAWWLAGESALLLGCCAWLWTGVPRGELLAFLASGAALTAAAVWVTLRNRQRSRLFQMVSAAGLGLTGPLASLVVLGTIEEWAWLLWACLTFHAAVSILIVHMRLERRAGRAAAGSAVAPALVPLLAVPPAITLLAAGYELSRLRTEAGMREPLRRGGFPTPAGS
ncbi:MAG TPA: hypothetical protein DEH78_04085, partial [Solibacterales bacterium]|nr:hypothetical protein [Bryobacterales bacterium]